MLAEFDMFSGRPNPSWTLLDTETKTLVEKLKSLPAATDGAVNDRLGYRGIVLMSTDDSDTGFVNVIVSAGLVIVTESDSRQRRLADVGRSLERWLAETSRGKVDPNIYAGVQSELGP